MSFKGYKRSIKLEFDYDEVKKGIPNVKKQMAILNSEFKKTYEEAKTSGKEIDKLGARYDLLSNKVKIQSQEVSNYAKKLEGAKNAQGSNSKAIENATTSLEIARAKLGQTEAQLEQVTQELEKQKAILGKTSDEWGKLSEKTTEIGKNMTMKLTVPILAAAGASFKLGADFEQSLGKMKVVFESNSKSIEKWAQNSLRDFGLAKSTAIEMAGDFGALFKGMGMNLKQTEEWSTTLTERTMDLANFYDTTVEETNRALNAIVTGQTEPLRRFGINMTQASLQEYAYAEGIKKKVSEMTEAEKVQLRYNFVIERTNIAVGTTARESDTATGQMNKFKESVKELGLSFSEEILPIFTPVIKGLNTMTEKFANLSTGTRKFIVTVGGIVAAIGPVLLVLGSVFGAIKNISEGMKVAKTALGAVGKAGKLFSGLLNNTAFMGFAKWALVIAGVALAIAALVTAINYLIGKGKEMNQFSKDMTGMVGNIGNSISGAKMRGYAVGIQYAPQGPAIVGENGPELMNFRGGENVKTNDETRNILGGGDTFNLNVKMEDVDQVYKLVNVFENFVQTKRAGVVKYG